MGIYDPGMESSHTSDPDTGPVYSSLFPYRRTVLQGSLISMRDELKGGLTERYLFFLLLLVSLDFRFPSDIVGRRRDCPDRMDVSPTPG